jgi:hypothetical protein
VSLAKANKCRIKTNREENWKSNETCKTFGGVQFAW